MAKNQKTTSQSNEPHIAVESCFPNNHSRVDFTMTEAIAPDFYVGYGFIGGGYESYLGSPRWDPLRIGVDKVLRLMLYIRKHVPGVTEEIHAKGYRLTIEIADSYSACRDDVIEKVKYILEHPDVVDAEDTTVCGEPVTAPAGDATKNLPGGGY